MANGVLKLLAISKNYGPLLYLIRLEEKKHRYFVSDITFHCVSQSCSILQVTMQLKSFIYVLLKSNNVVKKFHPVVT